jgi:hypothetical protein
MAPPLRRDPRSSGNNRGEGLTERAIVKVNPEVDRECFFAIIWLISSKKTLFFSLNREAFSGMFVPASPLYGAVFAILRSSSPLFLQLGGRATEPKVE